MLYGTSFININYKESIKRQIIKMKWSNKIVYCDKSISKISTRSLSKFKKLQLGASKHRESSNSLLQKSQLRLKSFDKMQTQHKKQLSFYMDKKKLDEINQSGTENSANKDSRKSLFHNIFTEGKSQFFKQSIKNNQMKNPFSNNNLIEQTQLQDKPEFQKFLTENYGKSSIKKIISIANNLKLIAKQLKKMVNVFKIELNKNIQRSVEELKSDLHIFLKQYTMKLQLNFQQLNGNFGKPIKTRRTDFQDTTFINEEIINSRQQREATNIGPVKFKNKFKKVITNSKQEQIQSQMQTYTKKSTTSNHHQNQNDNAIKLLTRSPARKRSKSKTYQRVNSLIYSSHCDSQSSRYIKRQVDKSGSKSIKKIQQRLISMRKILTRQSQEVKCISRPQNDSVSNSLHRD